MKYITLPLDEYNALIEEIRQLKQRKDAPLPDIEDITFLSPRLYGHLNRHGIVNLADIEKTTKDEWIRKVGFGRKSWEELKNLMKLYALKFKEE